MTENIIMLIIGLLVGAGAIWLVTRSRITAAVDQARSGIEGEKIALVERLQARDQQIVGLTASLAKANEQLGALQGQVLAESGRRSAAEERNGQIPKLVSELEEKERQIWRLKITHLLRHTIMKEFIVI